MTDHRGAASESAARDRGLRRLRWVLIAGGVAWCLVAGRLVQLQAVDHQRYASQARDQHERQIPLSARRGPIIDRDGRELAFDVSSVSFYCRPPLVREGNAVAAHFGRFGGRSPDGVRQLLRSARPFVYLQRQVSDAQLALLRARRFEGVYEQSEVRRHYPYGRVAGQFLGFTDIDNRGFEGVELAFDELLAERAGSAQSFVDGQGNVLPDRLRPLAAPRNGASVQLTLDIVIQGILEEELARTVDEAQAESAFGVIADPMTGDILALASVPLFDPNDPGAAPAEHRRNRLITDPFEPGSTFKPITMAAVLEADPAAAAREVFCEQGVYELTTGDTIRDVSAHGWLTASQVMSLSSNIGVIKLARSLERADFYESLRSFGFGMRSGIGLPAESAGLLSEARAWSERSLETIAIGQEVSVTAVQLVQAFGAIANGGTLMAPRVLSHVRDADGQIRQATRPQAVRRVVSPGTADRLRAMLSLAVREGTGRAAAIPGVEVAGKTGTAQRALPGGGGYAEDEYVASFVGFLPATRTPRYVCLVVVDNPRLGKWGGTVAAPAFRRTMERVLGLDGAVPRAAVAATVPEPRGDDRVPDFRGMDRSRVRDQAQRRDLTVRFHGAGELVVEQDPAPRTAAAGQAVLCRLGSEADVLPVGRREAPARQAVLLRKLRGRQLVALAP